MEQYDNNEKVDQQGSEKLLSFCTEEEHDASDGWCVSAQNWYSKG